MRHLPRLPLHHPDLRARKVRDDVEASAIGRERNLAAEGSFRRKTAEDLPRLRVSVVEHERGTGRCGAAGRGLRRIRFSVDHEIVGDPHAIQTRISDRFQRTGFRRIDRGALDSVQQEEPAIGRPLERKIERPLRRKGPRQRLGSVLAVRLPAQNGDPARHPLLDQRGDALAARVGMLATISPIEGGVSTFAWPPSAPISQS